MVYCGTAVVQYTACFIHIMPVTIFQGKPLTRVRGPLGSGTGVIPVKGSHTRIKLKAAGFGFGQWLLCTQYGRYITVTPERKFMSVGKWSLYITIINFWSFHFRNGYEFVRDDRFTS
jgi:hypothetical protein